MGQPDQVRRTRGVERRRGEWEKEKEKGRGNEEGGAREQWEEMVKERGREIRGEGRGHVDPLLSRWGPGHAAQNMWAKAAPHLTGE